jgi:hypothetical protein
MNFHILQSTPPRESLAGANPTPDTSSNHLFASDGYPRNCYPSGGCFGCEDIRINFRCFFTPAYTLRTAAHS